MLCYCYKLWDILVFCSFIQILSYWKIILQNYSIIKSFNLSHEVCLSIKYLPVVINYFLISYSNFENILFYLKMSLYIICGLKYARFNYAIQLIGIICCSVLFSTNSFKAKSLHSNVNIGNIDISARINIKFFEILYTLHVKSIATVLTLYCIIFAICYITGEARGVCVVVVGRRVRNPSQNT